MNEIGAFAVSWWSVHEFVTAQLHHVEHWPLIGTPLWCELSDDDPVKLAAILDAAQHWALRVETCQEGLAQVSRDISTAENWSAIAAEILQRRGSGYIPREVA